MRSSHVFWLASASAILVCLFLTQSGSAVAQVRPRGTGGYGRPGQPRDPRTEEFMRKALQEKRDEELVKRAKPVIAGPHVEVYQEGLVVDPQFLAMAEDAYSRLQDLTGRTFDFTTLGPKIQIFVSTEIRVSHVWKGYDHPRDPRGIIFLNPRVYARALAGADATFIHEMAHLLTWRFYSPTLREGIANYLAQQVRPGAGSGANPVGYDWSVEVSKEIASYLGTTKEAPRRMTGEPESRGVYYYACYRFVKYLIEARGMEVFLRLYESRKPEDEFPKLYGATRKELVAAGM